MRQLFLFGSNEKTQNVVTRAQLIPAISSALGNLMSTQSPVLRRKVESLVPEPAAGSGLDKVLDELHRRTQILLLRSSRDQKIKTCVPRVNALSAHPPDLVLSQEGGAEWIDDDVVSYTSEGLPEYGDLYDEHCVGGEVVDLTHSEPEYQEQRLAPDEAHQQYAMDTADFYDESDRYEYYYEMSDIEGAVQPTAHVFVDYSADSSRAAGNLEDAGDDYPDFVADEDDVICDDTYEHLGDDGTYFDEGPNDSWETSDDYYQGAMLHGGGLDQQAGPDYITAGHVHHNEQAEAAESNTRVGWHGQVLQDWSQVPRNYAYHGTEEQWVRPGPHPTTLTSRLADYQ